MLGVTFGTYHSNNDFGLILADTNIGAAEPMRYTVEVAGRNGIVDLTNAMSPYTHYRERVITYTFNTLGHCNWQEKMREVGNAIHGRKLWVIDDDDTSYHWEGLVAISQQSSQERLGTIVIIVTAFPFKMRNSETVKTITGNGTLHCDNERLEVNPRVTCTAECTLTFGSETRTIEAGTRLLDFLLEEGTNDIGVVSTGTTTITYREGAL